MRKNAVKVLTALVDNCREADDFRARTHDNQKFQLAVVGEFHVAIISLYVHNFFLDPSTPLRSAQDDAKVFGVRMTPHSVMPGMTGHLLFYFTTFSPKVSGWFGSNSSLAHMTVTRFSVCERLIMLCV